MPLTAAATDKFQKVGLPGSATTLSAPGYTVGNSSISVGSNTNWPTDTLVTFAIDQAQIVSGVEQRVPNTYCEFEGIVTGPTTVGSLTLKVGNAQNYPAGSLTRVYISVSSNRENALVDGLNQDHNGKGNHKTLTDDNGNEWLERGQTASAVNQTKVTNAATGNAPAVTASGDDANIDHLFGAKGSGSPRFYGNHDGWVLDTDTWVYVSASSFKISGKDVTARFPAGTKIKLNQSGSKYFYVTSATFSTDTTVNITAGSDYTLANASITLPMFSYKGSPQGFPGSFNWAPTFTNWTVGTGGNAATVATFTMVGKLVFFRIRSTLGSSGQSVSGAITFTLPVSANAELASASHEGYLIGECKLLDFTLAAYQGRVQINGATASQAFLIAQNASSTYLSQATTSATIPFSWGAGDMFLAEGFYEAA